MEAAAAAQVTVKVQPTLALLAQPTEDKEELERPKPFVLDEGSSSPAAEGCQDLACFLRAAKQSNSNSMEVSFLQLAKSNLAAYLDSQQKDIRKDSRKDGDDIPRHSSLIAEADPVVRRAMGESTKPVVHRTMADDEKKVKSAGGAMKKLKKKLKAKTKIADAHDRIDEMAEAKKKLKKKQKADEKKEAAKERKEHAESRKEEAEQEEEGEDGQSAGAEQLAGAEQSAVSDASSGRVAARKAEKDNQLQQRQAQKDMQKAQAEARAQQKLDAREADKQRKEALKASKEALKAAKESGAEDEASQDEGSRMAR
jgi:hypothetical protein